MYKISRQKYACGILDEMRNMDKTKNYSALSGHIEMLQVFFQNMEDALAMQSEFKYLEEARKNANSLVNRYNKEIEKKSPDMKKVKEILDELKNLR